MAMSPVSFVQPGQWVLALRSVPASSETLLGIRDVADGPSAHRSFWELLPDGGLGWEPLIRSSPVSS